ncbi:glycoside hydrolase family 32 protein [Enterococcus sp. AZ103]|uniref:glycoside hydrolase family 32 protein n=1 Tax=Enterococcus sp. AZ103 TaxID=2774628 RepID=UPI003F297922
MDNNIINYRYAYHLSPQNGWMNDPNGLIFYKNHYHVFYQINPHDNRPGDIYWGHFISKDLIKWKALPYALSPDKDYDQNGCYSGGAYVQGEQLYLAYTGHKNMGTTYEEKQCVAISNDGIQFKKLKSNPIISNRPQNNTQRFRDPRIYKVENSLFMIVGGESSKEGFGQVQLYESNGEMDQWTYKGILIKARDGDGTMWECPDYFELSNEKFLLVSPKGLKNTGTNEFCSMWIKNNFLFKSEVTDYHMEKIDQGQDFYAAQTFYDPIKKRQLMIAWFGMPGLQEKENNPQVGALTLPREIKYINKKLHFFPIEEMKKLRLNQYDLHDHVKLPDTIELDATNHQDSFEINVSSKKNNVLFSIIFKENELIIMFKDSIRHGIQKVKDIKVQSLRLFLDKGLTELFINNGEYSFTNKCDLLGAINIQIRGSLDGNIYSLINQ